jgi:photosystem II stability/assembly factor-like uncharacterized protein
MSWTEANNIVLSSSNKYTSICCSADGNFLAACTNEGSIYTIIYTIDTSGLINIKCIDINSPTKQWTSICCSDGGTFLAACANESSIYIKSSNIDNEWVQIDTSHIDSSPNKKWTSISCSYNGTFLAACVNEGYIYTIDTSDLTNIKWIDINSPTKQWTSICCSDGGNFLAACANDDYIYINSSNTDNEWVQIATPNKQWTSISCSYDGQFIAACNEDSIYTSDDYGLTFNIKKENINDLTSISVSSSGQSMIACNDSNIYISNDFGDTWQSQNNSVTGGTGVCISSSGEKLAACNKYNIYTSNNNDITTMTDTFYSEALSSYTDSLKTSFDLLKEQETNIITIENVNEALSAAESALKYAYEVQKYADQAKYSVPSDYLKLNDIINKAQTDANEANTIAKNVVIDACNIADIITLKWEKIDTLINPYVSICSSGNGTILVACVENGGIYKSVDSGNNWELIYDSSTISFRSVCCSDNGNIIFASSNNQIRYSNNSGVTWVILPSDYTDCYSICCSPNGDIFFVVIKVDDNTIIYKNTANGNVWSSVSVPLTSLSLGTNGDASSLPPTNFKICCYSGASQLVACVANDGIYTTSTNNINWVSISTQIINKNWSSINCSSLGQYMFASYENGGIYRSIDFGKTWNEAFAPFGIKNLICCNSTASQLVAFIDSYIYTNDYPVHTLCFNKGSKILSLDNQYIPIENLKKGDFVKVYKSDNSIVYKKIDKIGYNTMINDPSTPIHCMYRMIQTKENGLIEDLILTGIHSILVDDFKKCRINNIDKMYSFDKIEDKILLFSFLLEDFFQEKNNEKYTYYHLSLESEDETEKFGVWANGLLVETTSKNHFEYNLLNEY